MSSSSDAPDTDPEPAVAAAVAAAIAAAITARTHLPVTAAAAVGVVTLTAQQSGTVGNSIDVRMNRFAGEADPAGLTFVLVAVGGVVAGSGEATVDATLWAALGSSRSSSTTQVSSPITWTRMNTKTW